MNAFVAEKNTIFQIAFNFTSKDSNCFPKSTSRIPPQTISKTPKTTEQSSFTNLTALPVPECCARFDRNLARNRRGAHAQPICLTKLHVVNKLNPYGTARVNFLGYLREKCDGPFWVFKNWWKGIFRCEVLFCGRLLLDVELDYEQMQIRKHRLDSIGQITIKDLV